MIVETTTGRVLVIAQSPDLESDLLIQADTSEAIQSALNVIELVGGAEGDDPVFTPESVTQFTRFGKPVFQAQLTRGQVSRWLDAEIHNYIDYSSVKQLRAKESS